MAVLSPTGDAGEGGAADHEARRRAHPHWPHPGGGGGQRVPLHHVPQVRPERSRGTPPRVVAIQAADSDRLMSPRVLRI
eukprot:7469228-Pyramimonas_sp.AAC.1